MKPIKTFRIGSLVFFDKFEDFKAKDIDELCIMDEFPFEKTNVLHANGLHGKDVFFFRNMSKEQWLEETKKTKLPMVVGKFIVPEFCEYLNISINDLKELESLFNRLDEAHSYEKIIYDSYIENNGFYLTDKQRERAYARYKEIHKNL